LSELVVIVIIVALIGVAFGLSFWTHHARHDRSARVGLFLLLGFRASSSSSRGSPSSPGSNGTV